MTYRLIPLDEAIVFPTVTATLPIDVGEEERVFLMPRRDGEFGRVGVVAEVIETGLGRRGRPVATVVGLHRGLIAGGAEPAEDETLRVEVQEIRDGHPDDEHTRELSTEYRAVVEEILEHRGDDGRIAAFLRSIDEPGALADTSGLSPDIPNEGKLRLLEAIDVTARLELAVELQRERLTELQVRSKIRDDVESGAQKQQRDYFLRKQMESIRKELGEDEADLIGEYERKIAEAGMPEAVAEQAEKELRRLERQGEQSPESSHDPQLPRLADRGAVGEALRGAARPGPHPRGARRRPRRPRGREEADHRVHRRAQAARGARDRRRQPRQRRDPHPGRPSRHRQDLDRRVDRGRPRARVRPHQPRRHPRRGRDPRPPPHLHRRDAGTDRPRPARRQDDEPGDPPRRGRQGRRRLARRPLRGPARGARPGPERHLPRPLPRRRGRPLRGRLHRHRQPGRHDPGAVAGPDGDHRLRRLHDRGEAGDRPRLPAAAAAEAERAAAGGGRGLRRRCCAR